MGHDRYQPEGANLQDHTCRAETPYSRGEGIRLRAGRHRASHGERMRFWKTSEPSARRQQVFWRCWWWPSGGQRAGHQGSIQTLRCTTNDVGKRAWRSHESRSGVECIWDEPR